MKRAGPAHKASAWAFALWLIPALGACAFMVFYFDFLSDDAFISFRYARNLVEGQGLVFNPGERVEGYTNFLEVMTLAGLGGMGMDLVTAGRGFSLVGALATVVLAGVAAWRFLAFPGSLVWAVPLLIAVTPHLAIWGGSGLESTMFAALLIGLALGLMRGKVTGRGFVLISLLGLLLAWTRPEGVFYYGMAAVLAFAFADGSAGRRLRALWPGLLFFAVAGAGYMAWRVWYFGDWLPNTFHVKGGFSLHHVTRGIADFMTFAINPFAQAQLILAMVSGVSAVCRRDRGMIVVLVMWVAVVLVSVVEGGDGLPMFRFFVPAVPFMAMAALDGCHRASRWLLDRGGTSPRVVMGSALLVVAMLLVLPFFPQQGLPYRRFVLHRDIEVPAWSRVGRALAERTPPDTVVAAYPVGALGYYSKRTVIDMAGLTDPVIAQTPVANLGTGWAGHEKHNGPYVLSREPDMLLLGNIYVSRQPELPPELVLPKTWPAYYNREGDVVEDPRFMRDYERSVMPLGDGLFLHYYMRRQLDPQSMSNQ